MPLTAASLLRDLPHCGAFIPLSPTDVSQFVRLEQCERYLRLRLHERVQGSGFLADYGVTPQSLPPLLTRAGMEFEQRVSRALAAAFPTRDLAQEAGRPGSRPPNNAEVLGAAAALAVGERVVLLQPRLQVELEGWMLTGDLDLLSLSRGPGGRMEALIVDLKSSSQVKVEHRLQVAFYSLMLEAVLADGGVAEAQVSTGILYRGPRVPPQRPDPQRDCLLEEHAQAAQDQLGLGDAYLEVVADPESYRASAHDMVLGPHSTARRVANSAFEALSFHLSDKCDGCVHNQFCLKAAAETDDLSLLPHLSAPEKGALKRLGIDTIACLAHLKQPETGASGTSPTAPWVPAPGQEDLCRHASHTWPVGPRIDELVMRARRYRRWRGEDLDSPRSFTAHGYGSLPYCDATQNPNLVRVYIDAQHDHLEDRVYLLGSRVVACKTGAAARSRNVVALAEGPPDEDRERALLLEWLQGTLRAVLELAEPDATGEAWAPIHLIFYDAAEQRLFLDALSRHLGALAGAAPAFYDFATQLAAFDSPVATFLKEEIRQLRNYPMLCQSLQAVSAYLGFRWDETEPFTRLFRERLFDVWRSLTEPGEEPDWFTGRARFGSRIPLEHAYAAWDELEPPQAGARDDYAPYRATTRDLLTHFQARRLEAMEHIASSFEGNRLTQKRAFNLVELARFDDRARHLARALEEFVTLERHTELHEWKTTRHLAPERRALLGETLLLRYVEADQEPDVAAANRRNQEQQAQRQQLIDEARAAEPDAEDALLSPEQKKATRWDPEGLRVRLRVVTEGMDSGLEELLAATTLGAGSFCVLHRRWTWDSRLSEGQRESFTPTPKQLLYGMRCELSRLEVERGPDGRPTAAVTELSLRGARGTHPPLGYVFRPFLFPLEEDTLYTLDPSPDNWPAWYEARTVQALSGAEAAGAPELAPLYLRLSRPPGPPAPWPAEAARAQAEFLAGLDALHAEGLLHDFEPAKRAILGGLGECPILVVQGPPGTGKSHTTAFAILSRLQGALAAGMNLRVLVSCKTHAAIDVLLSALLEAREVLRTAQATCPGLYAAHFHAGLLGVPLFRFDPRADTPEGITPLAKEREKGQPPAHKALGAQAQCVVGMTPSSAYKLAKDCGKELLGQGFCQLAVLDEASQLSLPEALMSSLLVEEGGPLMVVGDHRQMPPILRRDWASEPRRTFREYAAYESLFETLLPRSAPPGATSDERPWTLVQFEES
ncbi:MAG TPA: AAA domain-containing protein, partial [Armatimonadota bacterium]